MRAPNKGELAALVAVKERANGLSWRTADRAGVSRAALAGCEQKGLIRYRDGAYYVVTGADKYLPDTKKKGQ